MVQILSAQATRLIRNGLQTTYVGLLLLGFQRKLEAGLTR